MCCTMLHLSTSNGDISGSQPLHAGILRGAAYLGSQNSMELGRWNWSGSERPGAGRSSSRLNRCTRFCWHLTATYSHAISFDIIKILRNIFWKPSWLYLSSALGQHDDCQQAWHCIDYLHHFALLPIIPGLFWTLTQTLDFVRPWISGTASPLPFSNNWTTPASPKAPLKRQSS